MRSFHLVYLIMFLYAGGLIGEYLIKGKAIRWIILFVPLSLIMFSAQCYQFPASDHIEVPGTNSKNLWVQAFQWIRQNTPRDAFFALDPYFMENSGADFHGFRALAERSMMPDLVKDPAVVSVLLTANRITDEKVVDAQKVAQQWHEQVSAIRDWKNLTPEDFRHLKERFGVNWIVLDKAIEGMECVYDNNLVRVYRID